MVPKKRQFFCCLFKSYNLKRSEIDGPVLRRHLEGRTGKSPTSPTRDGARRLHCGPGMAVSFWGGLSSIRDLGKCILPSYPRIFALHQDLDSVDINQRWRDRSDPGIPEISPSILKIFVWHFDLQVGSRHCSQVRFMLVSSFPLILSNVCFHIIKAVI